MKTSPGSVLLAVGTLAVLVAVGAGIYVIGSPGEERAYRIDDRRVADLKTIAAATDLYWTRNTRLPVTLDELAAEPGVTFERVDPVRGDPYGYTPADSVRYEVCATFDRASRELAMEPREDLWAHGSGRQCFDLEAEEVPRTERREGS